jgi:acetyltransferase
MDTGWADLAFPVFEDLAHVSREEFRKMMQADVAGLIEMPTRFDKPVMVSTFFGRNDQAARRLQDGGIPVFSSPEKAAAATATLEAYHRKRSRIGQDHPEKYALPATAPAIEDQARKTGWDEYRAKEMLRAYGVPTCREHFTVTATAALAAAETIGYPVALKACHPGLPHKSERGLVHLGLTSPAEVEVACAAIRAQTPPAGFLVCEMVAGEREFIAGVHRRPGFPPCVLFGLGGIWAEAIEDTAIRLAPLSPMEALDQVGDIRAQKLLEAGRGRPAVDRRALAEILIKLGRLALDFPSIAAIDLNPILIRDGLPVVVDALFEIQK